MPPATDFSRGTVSGGVPTPLAPPFKGGKVMAAAMAFSTGNGVVGVRPHPPWPRKGHAACYGFFPGNGVGGVRPHPPWPPLIKGGKGHGGRDGFFHGERCRGRASHPPWPPLRKGGKEPGRSPRLRNKDGRNARVMQGQLFTGPVPGHHIGEQVRISGYLRGSRCSGSLTVPANVCLNRPRAPAAPAWSPGRPRSPGPLGQVAGRSSISRASFHRASAG